VTLFESIIIAIVEGITEYLPVSSTGHMILAEYFLGVPQKNFTKLFTVSIQLGAILSVLVLYRKKFLAPLSPTNGDRSFYLKLLIGVFPALLLGKLFDEAIESLLESPLTVSISLFAGGFILLFIDQLFHPQSGTDEKPVSYQQSFLIGCWQCIAMIPGISRSAASIIGGMQQKLSRAQAAEFSFFLAVPTMAAATGYSIFLKDWKESGVAQKGYEIIFSSSTYTQAFIAGNIVAFIVAMLAIKFFISFLQKHGFRFFGWYRIIVGAILLLFIGLQKL
jgi:undecaprenyl-diphosphatase